MDPLLHKNELMPVVLPSSVILRSLTLAVLGALPLGLIAASAHAPAPPQPESVDSLKARDRELEALRAEQRRTLENEARLKREIESICDDRRKFNQPIVV